MPTPQRSRKILESLEVRSTLMLGLDGVEDGHARPMTAQLNDATEVPIWFFAAKNAIVQRLRQADRPSPTLRRRDTLFATVHGRLSLDRDRAVIDRAVEPLCRGLVRGGKDDPKLALLRLDPERAEIWGDASSFVAGIKMLIGIDPKQDYKDKVAEVSLRSS